MKKILLATGSMMVATFSLSACGGGSGGGSPGSTPAQPPSKPDFYNGPATGNTTASPYSLELYRSRAYTLIGGTTAYLQGARGQNTTVALVDGGVTRSTANGIDFTGRIHPASADIVNGRITAFHEDDPSAGRDGNDHASAIASIISAARDGRNFVGVAPEALLLSLDADDGRYAPHYAPEDVATAIRYASDIGSTAINLSIGGSDFPEIGDAVRYASHVGQSVIVTSAGNDGDSFSFPAAYATGEIGNGRVLAVGSIDADLKLSDFSARPSNMNEAAYFIVAPGEGVPTVNANGEWVIASGTSFAAPFVSGAVAALKSKYSHLDPDQLIDIILTTARDLGEPGTDLTYGRGLLDLAAALQPVGKLSLAAGDGSRTLIENTQLSLGHAFGDALASTLSLNRAIALDGFGRGFAANLSHRIDRARFTGFLEQRLAGREEEIRKVGGMLGGGAFNLQAADRPDGTGHEAYLGERRAEQHDVSLSWTSDDTVVGRIEAGLNLSPSQRLLPSSGQSGLFAAAGDMVEPVAGLTESGRSLKVSGKRLAFALHQSDGDERGPGLAMQGRLELADGLNLTHSLLIEEGGGLGSSGDGAFAGFGSGATSQFLGFSASGEAAGWTFGADVTLGMTRMSGSDPRLSDWSTVTSSAFALHASRTGIAMEDDRFGFIFGQPLRVEGGSVDVTMPVAQNSDGSLAYRTDRATLSPTGRELRAEFVYERPVGEDAALTSFLLLRHQPDHIAGADDEAVAGVRLNMRW
ncbi:MAG: S8 family serine peptidase [Geminicoccaceae bacterium]